MKKAERIIQIEVVGDDIHINSYCVYGVHRAKPVKPIIAKGLAKEWQEQTEQLSGHFTKFLASETLGHRRYDVEDDRFSPNKERQYIEVMI